MTHGGRAFGLPWLSLLVLPGAALWLGSGLAWLRPVAPAETVVRDASGAVVRSLPPGALDHRPEGGDAAGVAALAADEVLELRFERPPGIVRVRLQAPHDRAYLVAGSPDGQVFTPAWIAPGVDPPGLRTRWSPRTRALAGATHLRVGASGNAPWSAAEVTALAPTAVLPAWGPPLALWLAWAVLASSARRGNGRARAALARWLRCDACVAAACAALVFPSAALPLLAGVGLYLGITAGAGGARLRSAWGLAAVLLATCTWFALVTRMQGQLFGPEMLGAAYDSLADGLAAGHAQVAPWAIRFEAMEIDGRSYMYWGPFPALLRLAPHRLAPPLYGQLCRASCLLAAFLTLAAFGGIARRQLASAPPARARWLVWLSLLGFGLGSPLAYLMYAGALYHEAILWGLCAATWGIFFALPLIASRAPGAAGLAGLSTAAGVALLSRVTFGVPLYGVLVLAAGRRAREGLRGGGRAAPLARVALALLPAFLAGCVQLWYNADRFGSPFTAVAVDRLGHLVEHESSWRAIEEHGIVSPLRIPNALRHYFLGNAESYAAQFPWLRVARVELDPALHPEVFLPYSFAFPLLLTSPWILAGAGLGLLGLARRPRALPVACALLFLAEFGLVTSYYVIVDRYVLDLFPLLIFAYAAFLAGRAGDPARRGVVPALAAAVALSLLATLSVTVSAIPRSPFVPRSYKAAWVGVFRGIDARVAAALGYSEDGASE